MFINSHHRWRVVLIALFFPFLCSSQLVNEKGNAPHYTAVWKYANPVTEIFTNLSGGISLDHLMTIFPAQLREVQLPSDIFDYNDTDADLFTQRVKNESIIIQVVNINDTDDSWSFKIIDKPNAYGVQFNKTLSNGALVSFSYALNLVTAFDLPIPRAPNDLQCEMPNRYEYNCSCDANHTIDIYSLKFAMEVYNWTFAPLYPNRTFPILILNLELTGNFDLLYYLSLEDISNLITFPICDVGGTDLRLTKNVTVPISFFSNANLDGVPAQISTVFDQSTIRFNNDGATFPFQLLFGNFSQSLIYDPDFSVLIGGVNGGAGGGDGEETDTSGNGDGSADKTTMIVLVSVLVPIAVLVVIAVVLVSVVMGYLKRKKLAGILHKIQLEQESASQSSA